MRTILTILLTLFISTFGFSQENENSFSFALKSHLKKYNPKVNEVYERNDMERAQIMFDSLVSNHLVGTQFEDYTLKSFEKKKLKLSSFDKPIFILTYASWCVPSKGEFQALNKLAQKYSKDVKFVLLFWDKKYNIKKIAKKFNHNISVCYANESYKNDALIVAHLKHTLGFPTSYFLDQDLKVVSIKRGGVQLQNNSSYINAFTLNYNNFKDGLSSILINKNLKQEQLTNY